MTTFWFLIFPSTLLLLTTQAIETNIPKPNKTNNCDNMSIFENENDSVLDILSFEDTDSLCDNDWFALFDAPENLDMHEGPPAVSPTNELCNSYFSHATPLPYVQVVQQYYLSVMNDAVLLFPHFEPTSPFFHQSLNQLPTESQKNHSVSSGKTRKSKKKENELSRHPWFNETGIGRKFKLGNFCHVVTYAILHKYTMVLVPHRMKGGKFIQNRSPNPDTSIVYFQVLNLQGAHELNIESGTRRKNRNLFSLIFRLSEEQFKRPKQLHIFLFQIDEHGIEIVSAITIVKKEFEVVKRDGVRYFFGRVRFRIGLVGSKNDQRRYMIQVKSGSDTVAQSSPVRIQSRLEFLENSLKSNLVELSSIERTLQSLVTIDDSYCKKHFRSKLSRQDNDGVGECGCGRQ